MNFLAPLLGYYDRLAPRERLLLGLALLSVILIGGYSFVWDPLVVSGEQLTKKIAQREKDLTEVQRLHDNYLELLRELEAMQTIADVDPNFNILKYLQAVIGQVVTKDKIASMNPTTKPRPEAPEFQEELVDIKLTAITLPQIADLMFKVEKGEHPLHFSRIVIKKRFNEPHSFDVNASVAVLKSTDKPIDAKQGGGA